MFETYFQFFNSFEKHEISSKTNTTITRYLNIAKASSENYSAVPERIE